MISQCFSDRHSYLSLYNLSPLLNPRRLHNEYTTYTSVLSFLRQNRKTIIWQIDISCWIKLYIYYLTNRLHFSVCVFCNRSLLFFIRCDVFCDLLQYTHTWKNAIYLFYNGLLKDLGGMKKEKTSDLDLTPSVKCTQKSCYFIQNIVFLTYKLYIWHKIFDTQSVPLFNNLAHTSV